ncbi:non-specific serine/threonine protein kinase [Ranunculus cassubicifolius]
MTTQQLQNSMSYGNDIGCILLCGVMNLTGDTKFAVEESNRKKPGRGGGRPSTGRGRGSRSNDQARQQVSSCTTLPSNGQLESSVYKIFGKRTD